MRHTVAHIVRDIRKLGSSAISDHTIPVNNKKQSDCPIQMIGQGVLAASKMSRDSGRLEF